MLSWRNNNKLYSLFILVGIADICILVFIIHPAKPGPVFPLILLSIRGGISFMLFALFKYKTKFDNAGILGLFTSVFYFVFSVMGIGCMFLVLKEISNENRKLASLYHIDKEEGENDEDSSDIDDDTSINFDEIREVAPLTDGLADDASKIRIATIQAMEGLDDTNLFSHIVDSKNDKSRNVQYFAQDALTKVSDSYMKKIKELTDTINKSEPNYEDYKALADIYAEFAHKNIEHKILVEFYRKEAMKFYNDLLSNYPDRQHSILEKFIPVLFENGNYKECLEYCDVIYDDPILKSKSIEYKARCFFQARNIGTLKKLAEKESNSNLSAINNFLELCKEVHDG